MDQCFTFIKILDEKHKAGEILFQGGAVNINELPFSKHNDRGKGHMMMVSHHELEVEKDE